MRKAVAVWLAFSETARLHEEALERVRTGKPGAVKATKAARRAMREVERLAALPDDAPPSDVSGEG